MKEMGSHSGEQGFTARLYGLEDDDIGLIAGLYSSAGYLTELYDKTERAKECVY